jgi:hypothetical protein
MDALHIFFQNIVLAVQRKLVFRQTFLELFFHVLSNHSNFFYHLGFPFLNEFFDHIIDLRFSSIYSLRLIVFSFLTFQSGLILFDLVLFGLLSLFLTHLFGFIRLVLSNLAQQVRENLGYSDKSVIVLNCIQSWLYSIPFIYYLTKHIHDEESSLCVEFFALQGLVHKLLFVGP